MKKKIIGVIAIIAVIGILLGVYHVFREKPQQPNFGPDDNGSIEMVAKSVSIEIVGADGESKFYELSTHADYLKAAMEEADGLTYEAENGMVMVINGERADYNLDKAYWAFYVNGEYCNYGIADQPVNDGDQFKIEYTRV